MPLRDLLADGRIRPHRSSAREVADLLRVVDRDLADASITQLSTDRRFATAYNAALLVATIILHAAGYRTASAGHHWATFHVLPEILGPAAQARADYLDIPSLSLGTLVPRQLLIIGAAGMPGDFPPLRR